jgi:hypothetical protein
MRLGARTVASAHLGVAVWLHSALAVLGSLDIVFGEVDR